MSEREALREEMRRRRRELSAMHLMELSARIGEKVIAMKEYQSAKRVFCYCAQPYEVQTGGLIREMLRTGRKVYLPVTNPDWTLRAVRLTDPDSLHKGLFGIMEPDGDEEIDPAELDLILTPGLAFDRAGGRLGQGAGCFDRFLPLCRGLIAALTFESQLIDEVPMKPHDFRVQKIITEKAVYDCVSSPV